MRVEKRTVFLTGMTGTLGKDMLVELLQTTSDRLFLLVRSKGRISGRERVRKYLDSKGIAWDDSRIRVLEGDITVPELGLSAADREVLRCEVDHFFHVAALTALNGSREDCYRINLGGTEEALKLAWHLLRNGRLRRFYYFSTAFVAGSRQTLCAREDGLVETPAHANHYESSKYEAEKRVRAALKEGMPVTVFRPSIVVGNSVTGEVSEFNVIYPFMRLFAHGVIRRLPTDLDNSFNIVPIDFVTRASVAIAAQPESVGKTYHLVTKTPPTIRELIDAGYAEYPETPEIEILPLEKFDRAALETNERFIYDMMEPYLGYLNDHLSFDCTNTEQALKGTGIEFPKTDGSFLRRLIRYAVSAGYFMASSQKK